MPEVATTQAKYIYFDIVDFSRDRSVEAQTDIINAINRITADTVTEFGIPIDSIIYIPTGDGICIALLDVHVPYDIHVKLALRLLENIEFYNGGISSDVRKINVRIGVNENVDNIVTDINGRRNVTGAGIIVAQRVMDVGDGGNILVGRTVYDRLHQREYYEDKFKLRRTSIKHGEVIEIYQYMQEGSVGLNTGIPSSLVPPAPLDIPKPQLDETTAYYIALLIKHAEFVETQAGSYRNHFVFLTIMGLARARVVQNKSTTYQPSARHIEPLPDKRDMAIFGIDGDDRDPRNVYSYYARINFSMVQDYSNMLQKRFIEDRRLQSFFVDGSSYLQPKEEEATAIRASWSSVCNDVGI